MRTICSVTALYSNDIFIKPHFDMLKGVDKRIALIATKPWGVHSEEHGNLGPGNAEELLKDYPDVEIQYTDMTIEKGEDMAKLYNLFIDLAQGYDYVTRFDSDMLWTEKDWDHMINFIKDHYFDYYKMDFSNNSIDYYVDWDHGLMDAKETDTLVISTNNRFEWLTESKGMGYMMNWDGWMCHHFRGWNKPKTCGLKWLNSDYANENYKGKWYVVPPEIRKKFDDKMVKKWFKKAGL